MYILLAGNIIMFGLLGLRYSTLPPQIPLYYSRTWGEDQLVDWWMILMLPLFFNLLYFLNTIIYRKFFSGNIFVKKIIDYLNVFLAVSITFIFVKIILLVS